MSMGGDPEVTTSQVQYSPEQQRLISAASPALLQYARSGGVALPGISTIPGFNANQLAGQSGAINAAGGLAGYGQASTQAATNLLSGGENPHLEAAIRATERGIGENLGEQTLPRLRSEAVLTGNIGSSRQGIAEGLAGKAATQAAADARTKMQYDDYRASQQRMLDAIGMGGQVSANALAPSSVFDVVGGQQYGLEQSQAQDAYQRELYTRMSPYLASSDVTRLAMGLGSGSTTTTEGGTPDWLTALTGGAGIGLAMFA